MKIRFAEITAKPAAAALVTVADGNVLSATAKSLDKQSGGALSRAIKASRFDGEKGEFLELLAPQSLAADRILLAGVGEPKALTPLDVEALGAAAAKRVAGTGATALTIYWDPLKGAKTRTPEAAAHVAYGAELGSYRFDRYRTTEKPEKKPSLKQLTLAVGNVRAARAAYRRLAHVAEGVFFTRDLVSEPGNVIYPATLAKAARSLSRLGVKVQVLDRNQMKKLGMNALLGVAQGSANPPYLAVMQWHGGGRAKPVAFVGKGVTFDTGGISIKPAAGMEEMKWDMGGAGTVIGLMRVLAARKAKVNAVGVVGLVENMPSATAQRPGDVVTSMSGQTVEVINTDAEGRLVLGDALWYTCTRFKPRFIVDLATLTGAIIISLGHYHAGLFGNDDKLAQQLLAAGEAEGEKLWRLPLGEDYDKDINSDIADMKNIGAGRAAGSITAAQFLQRYVKDTAWAHLDIAGMAWTSKDQPTVPKGASGFGVRLLDRLVADNYEG